MHPSYTLLCLLLCLTSTTSSPPLPTPASDAVSLLLFKSKADLNNKLLYTLNERFDYCSWQGVKCVQGRVVRFALQSFDLLGIFPEDSLTHLDQLRALNLRNNSLTGPIPNLSLLSNLKTLFLDNNSFSGTFPPSLLSLHRLRTLDLSHNYLSGPLPVYFFVLDRINYLRLDSNRFNGSIPPLNQSSLRVFNVSNNNLTGAIPVTQTLSKFGISSFLYNPYLCGEIIHKPCRTSPFFESPASGEASPPGQLNENAESQGVVLSHPSSKLHKRIGVILGLVIGVLILIASILSLITLFKNRRDRFHTKSVKYNAEDGNMNSIDTAAAAAAAAAATSINQVVNTEVDVKDKQLQVYQRQGKSGSLIFCIGEAELYTLEQLMRASAELLGRGTIGTTYKAVMDNQLVVTVKRLDASKTAICGGDVFERHMEVVGGFRHPNLVPVRAYFQAKQERLIIYDYQPNGSLFNLVHGSRSTRAKPLHWTSCLKIAEDVAMGLAYIHQASKLIHGNLKSTNVLLGADFEACLTDYCVAILAELSSDEDPDSAGYKAPEIRKSNRKATTKSDVFAFAVLLLELLTGKPPSQHPFLEPTDMPDWVRAMRADDSEEDNCLRMLVEVAGICSLTSPEQRPAMWQVLKMIQRIKEGAMIEDSVKDAYSRQS